MKKKSKDKKKTNYIIRYEPSGNKLNFEIKFLPEFTEKLKKDSDILIKTF